MGIGACDDCHVSFIDINVDFDRLEEILRAPNGYEFFILFIILVLPIHFLHGLLKQGNHLFFGHLNASPKQSAATLGMECHLAELPRKKTLRPLMIEIHQREVEKKARPVFARGQTRGGL